MSWLSIVSNIAVFLVGLSFLIFGTRCLGWFRESPQSHPELIPEGLDPLDPYVKIICKISTILTGAVFFILSVVFFYAFFLNLK